jgi:hypothetical protein
VFVYTAYSDWLATMNSRLRLSVLLRADEVIE